MEVNYSSVIIDHIDMINGKVYSNKTKKTLLRILELLQNDNELTTEDMAAHLGIPVSYTRRAVYPLLHSKLVVRRPLPDIKSKKHPVFGYSLNGHAISEMVADALCVLKDRYQF